MRRALHIFAVAAASSGFVYTQPAGPEALVFTILGGIPIVVPDPASAALVALGLFGLVRAGRRRAFHSR